MKGIYARATYLLAGLVLWAAPATEAPAQASRSLSTAILAGGRFWALESALEATYGVVSAVSGYTGGTGRNPTQATYARDGHVEAVRVSFDPSRVSFRELLEVYWKQVDPTDPDGQFAERGRQFRTIVFWADETQKREAEASRAALAASGRLGAGRRIVTEIAKAAAFTPAEEAEQDYARRNPEAYVRWRSASGRPALADPWAPPGARDGGYRKPADSELSAKLSAAQYAVTQECGTEPPFMNEYWDNHREGIYVDVVSGEPLFSSRDKFDSGTGWPSFTQPLAPANIVSVEDRSYGMVRVEVRSRFGDSHLGHLFDDGPGPTGLRYCINSASLRFIPLEEMEKEGYGRYLALFGD